MVGPRTWAVFGNARMLSGYSEIYRFLSSKNIEIVSLSDEQVTDFGSLLPLASSSISSN
jgi:hypothetical protein